MDEVLKSYLAKYTRGWGASPLPPPSRLISVNKVAGLRPATLLKKRLAQVFLCERCEIKSTSFTEQFRKTASAYQRHT